MLNFMKIILLTFYFSYKFLLPFDCMGTYTQNSSYRKPIYIGLKIQKQLY